MHYNYSRAAPKQQAYLAFQFSIHTLRWLHLVCPKMAPNNIAVIYTKKMCSVANFLPPVSFRGL